MRYLPNALSEQLATKSDVAAIRDDLRHLEKRFDNLEGAMRDHLKTLTVTVASAMTGLTAIFGVMLAVSAD